jgi:phosphoesterase RecJ-like protein
MLDFNQPNRLGEAEESVRLSAAVKVIIDHHIDPYNIAELVISDTSKCSTAELIHEIIKILNGKPFLNKSYAEAIYVVLLPTPATLSMVPIPVRLSGSLQTSLIQELKRKRY